MAFTDNTTPISFYVVQNSPNIPVPPAEGSFYIHDNLLHFAFDTTGATPLSPIVFGSSLPSSGNQSKLYVNTASGTASWWNGSTWIQIGGSALSAASADTLSTARDFEISGGATAAAVSFNGSSDVELQVSSLAASYLTGAIPGTVTAVTQAASTNNTTIATTAFVTSAITANNANFVTQAEFDEFVTSAFQFKDILTELSELPSSNQEIGDVYQVTNSTPANQFFVWNGTTWKPLGGDLINLSGYVTLAGTQTFTGVNTFSQTINGSVSGNSGTTTALQTPRTFEISGGVTADPVSFNGTGNVNLVVDEVDATALVGTASVNTTGSAATLTTPRTISISGGATAAGGTFNGSAPLDLAVTSLGASYLTGAIPTGVTAVTQATGTNNTTIATTAYADRAADNVRLMIRVV